MTIAELIDLLEEAQTELGGDAEVRFASQPSWPFENKISDRYASADGVFYLAEAEQVGYLSGEVSQELGWV